MFQFIYFYIIKYKNEAVLVNFQSYVNPSLRV